MRDTRQRYIDKLIPHIEEMYEIHIKSLDIKAKELEEKTEGLRIRIQEAKDRKKCLVHNISRDTGQDLTSFHYLFFGVEGKITNG